MAEPAVICLICGVDTNKKQKHDRYNHVAPVKKKSKYEESEESDSDSDDNVKSKSKKKTPQRTSERAPMVAVGGRTRNQNPKTFASSLCKVMEVPSEPDEPFLEIFSRASYCTECMVKVKDATSAQMDLEKAQARVEEARMDIEIEMSKHLNTIPIHKNLLRRDGQGYDAYEEDLKLILNYTDSTKKIKRASISKEDGGRAPKRTQRQAAIKSAIKMKRKLEENGSEDNEEKEDEEPDSDVKPKAKTSKGASKYEGDEDFRPEDSTSSETEIEKEEPEVSSTDAEKEEEKPSEPENNTDNGSDEVVKKEEEPELPEAPAEAKPEIVKQKKDPNLKCPHCPIPRYFNFAENLTEHISKAHAHTCDVCDKRFKSESDAKKHKEKVHVQKTEEKSAFVCGFCDQDFQLKKYLEDHLDQHPEAKPLNCHACGRGFSRKESLQKAFQIYKGENVEGCKNCGKNLNLKDYLEHNRKLKEG